MAVIKNNVQPYLFWRDAIANLLHAIYLQLNFALEGTLKQLYMLGKRHIDDDDNGICLWYDRNLEHLGS